VVSIGATEDAAADEVGRRAKRGVAASSASHRPAPFRRGLL